jgi:sugar lactone lactonase YvrE
LEIPFGYILITRLGFGSSFPAQPDLWTSSPLLSESALEIVAELPLPPGNLAVHRNGRIFFTFHPEYSPPINVAELLPNQRISEGKFSSFKPFPSAEFQKNYKSILSMRIDHEHDRLWLLDFAHHAIQHPPALYCFQLANAKQKDDSLMTTFVFPKEVAGFGSMLNDFQIDPSGEYLYIIDTGILSLTPALVIYSVAHQRAFRVLNEHPSMYGPSSALSINHLKENTIRFGPFGLRIHADSLALDRSGSRLYYGALTGNRLYSISTSHLLNFVKKTLELNITRPVYHQQINDFVRLVTSEKPATDGLTTDAAGNIYLTGLEHSAIFVAIPHIPKDIVFTGVTDVQNLQFLKLISSPSLLRWPDGLCFGPDGLYISNSALHYKFLRKNLTDAQPFHILRIPTKELEKPGLYGSKKKFVLPPAGQ